jgi:hypothetical protein
MTVDTIEITTIGQRDTDARHLAPEFIFEHKPTVVVNDDKFAVTLGPDVTDTHYILII